MISQEQIRLSAFMLVISFAIFSTRCDRLPIGPTPTTPPPGVSNLQYFGYFRDSELFYNSICEIQDHVNYSMMDDFQAGGPVDPDKIRDAQTAGIHAWGVNGPSPLNGYLVLDDADIFAAPTSQLWETRKAELESKIPGIKAAYPNAHPTITLEGAFAIIPGFNLPIGYDWFGIQCFGARGNTLPDCKKRFNDLRPLLPSTGKVWIIVPAQTEYGDDFFLAQNAQEVYSWAKTEDRIIGLMAFVWQTELLWPSTHLATKDLPLLRKSLYEIGRNITKRKGVNNCNK